MFTLFLILSVVLFIARFILKNAFPRFADKHDGFIFLIYVFAIMLLIVAIIGALCLGGILISEDVLRNDIARAEESLEDLKTQHLEELEYLEKLRPENGVIDNIQYLNMEGAEYIKSITALKENIRSLKKELDMLDVYRWWLYFGGI